ncbi:MAG: protein kinase [Terracidiphilus sp.]
MEMVSFGEGWEGRVVEGQFPLLERMGSTENCALYFTVLKGMQEAIIQLISTDDAQAKTDIAQWTFAKSLSHPNLAKIFAAGRCLIDGKSLVYVVGEPSSTNLAKTIESGRLAVDRAKEIFNPIVDALKYLHRNGVVHGHLSPSNIHFAGSKPRLLLTDLLVAGPVKRSISAAGNYDAPELRHGEATAAADTWSLGLTIWEAMAQAPPSWDLRRAEEPQVPVSVPSPFREIVQDCLRLDPLRRCTLETIQERMSASESTPLREVTPPAKMEQPVIEDSLFDDNRPAIDLIGERNIPSMDQPVAYSSMPERIETEAPSDAVLFSRTLTHFEDARQPRSRVMPYAFVLLAVIAIGAFLYVREYQAGAFSTVTENAAAPSAPPTEKQPTARSAPSPEQTEPAQTQPEQTQPVASSSGSPEQSKEVPPAQPAGSSPAQASGVSQPQSDAKPAQASGTSQAETQSAPVNPPVSTASASVDRERTEENAKGLVEKRVLPTVSPGAREGMRRPVEVLIRVSVNREGTVSDAAYVEPGPGSYFARVAQRAALSWKFKPPIRNGDRERSVWMLRFNFTRAGTEPSATEEKQ